MPSQTLSARQRALVSTDIGGTIKMGETPPVARRFWGRPEHPAKPNWRAAAVLRYPMAPRRPHGGHPFTQHQTMQALQPLLRRAAPLLALPLMLLTLPSAGQAPASLAPTYQLNRTGYDIKGWAAATRGGQGGRLIKVSNLNADGPGSYREAVEASGPRTVVFEVGGVIDMAGQHITIKNPYLTIAGQTAPNPGISIIKAETVIATHDVIIQHLRFRPGEFGRPKKGGGDQDGISTAAGAYNVIVDHCSLSWATDENLSASGPRFAGNNPEDWRQGTSHNITYSYNLIYEGLSNSVHEKGEHSKGSLIHDNTSGVLLYANVYASNRERNALFKGGAQGAMVNNLIFNPGTRAAHYNLLDNEWGSHAYQTGRVTLVANLYRQGPDTAPGTALFTLRGQGDVELYLKDNLALDRNGHAVAQTDNQSKGKAQLISASTPYLPSDIRVYPVTLLEQALPAAVGARPWDRDALDSTLLADMAQGRGKIIDSEANNPLGYPSHPATRRAFVADDWNLADMSPKAGWAALQGPR